MSEVIFLMTYMSAQQAASLWGISKRRVQTLCSENRIPNATRIGNMWVVPEEAQKPTDARVKKSVSASMSTVNPIKVARRALKSISTTAFIKVQQEVSCPSDAKKTVMALFAHELLGCIINSPCTANDANDTIAICIQDMFEVECKLMPSTVSQIQEAFHDFINSHPFCIDDALSWTYQFINKLSLDSGLENTQFFTEKYMVAALVGQCKIDEKKGKILDPACGGGNFLLYAFDYLCDNYKPSGAISLVDFVRMQLDRLYGYDLDSILTLVASVNLRLKAMQILKEHGYGIKPNDFFSLVPNIYLSAKTNKEGALSVNLNNHKVVRAGTNDIETLAVVLSSAEFIFTNPPFQTVKGMPEDKKAFLKENYPNAKCDMCNAFIEFALNTISDKGICGLVTQNSWMYLDSFEQFRKSVFQKHSIMSIIELGSNAFYDISGEKSNVVLLLAQRSLPNTKTNITMYPLKHLSQWEIEKLLYSKNSINDYAIYLNQYEVMRHDGARFGTDYTKKTHSSPSSRLLYGEYAVPMQGTSTGDSKSLVGYFWEHIGDSDWCPVSKGGGFSRWLGLNNYSVKWGQSGEYIKQTPGSAIRNAKYFCETQFVFSDTGTAGLNVRELVDGQIFIASGPGIRVKQGKLYAHIAFLNSRFSSYYIRLLSPKITIAAGYIAKIPVSRDLIESDNMEHNALKCIASKKARLSKNPINLEYEALSDVGYTTTLDEQAMQWFLDDTENEWLQLLSEKAIDNEVLNALEFSSDEITNINTTVGCHALDIHNGKTSSLCNLDKAISELLSVNCTLTRTRVDKNHLGCDGVLEFLAHKNAISVTQMRQVILKNAHNFHLTLTKYRNAYIHSLVLSALGYSVNSLPCNIPLKTNRVMDKIESKYPSMASELPVIERWIRESLTPHHQAAFLDAPIIHYSAEHDAIKTARRLK